MTEPKGSLVPMVVERGPQGERAFDIYSRLLKDRIVIIGEPIAGEGFVDVINFRDRGNLVDVFTVETASGGYSSVRAWGTRFFPIIGVTIRW